MSRGSNKSGRSTLLYPRGRNSQEKDNNKKVLIDYSLDSRSIGSSRATVYLLYELHVIRATLIADSHG